MKNNIFFALFSAMLLLTACQQHEIDSPADLGDGFTLVGHTSAQTKTSFGTPEGNTIPFLWSEGDYICVGDNCSDPLIYAQAGQNTAEFTFSSGSLNEGDKVYYGGLTAENAIIPSLQSGLADELGVNCELGYGEVEENGTFTLEHLSSYIWLNTYTSVADLLVSKVIISAANDIVGKSVFNKEDKTFSNYSTDEDNVALSSTKVIELFQEYNSSSENYESSPFPVYLEESSGEEIWAVAVTYPVTTGALNITYVFVDEEGNETCRASYTYPSRTLEAGNTYRISQEIEAEDLYNLKTLTFEDVDADFAQYTLSYCSADISTWSDLIDETQYSGDILYSGSQSEGDYYSWTDKNNTFLAHHLPYNYNSYSYMGGGHAISNYVTGDYATYGNYQYQLTVYNPNAGDKVVSEGGGHNGSDNFCVHFGYMDGSEYNFTGELPSIYFGDGTPRVIDHMWVTNTVYALNCFAKGNSLTDEITEGDTFYVTATGYDKNDEKTGECTIYLVNGPDNIVDKWVKWDLSSLGKVSRVDFNVLGTSDNGYGFSQPAYFAYDDVAVRFPY